ncbi:hypothetical protein [Thermocrinis sp.]
MKTLVEKYNKRATMRSLGKAVESVNAQIKLFNLISKWRREITMWACLLGYAIGYSFFRKSHAQR